MSQYLTLAVNSIAYGGLLFLLSAGFSLIFGLMRIPNLMHGSFFMLGAYFGVSLIGWGTNFWLAAVLSGLGVAAAGRPGLAAGSADARLCLHHRRHLPDGLDRRSLAALGARGTAWRRAGLRHVLSALSPGDPRRCGCDRDRALD